MKTYTIPIAVVVFYSCTVLSDTSDYRFEKTGSHIESSVGSTDVSAFLEPILKWKCSSVSWRYNSGDALDDDGDPVTNSDIAIELSTAFDEWDGILSPTVSLSDSGYASNTCVDDDDGQNSLFWTDDDTIIYECGLNNALAVTLITNDDSDFSEIVDIDIVFNARDNRWITSGDSDSDASPPVMRVSSVAVHEIGHMLGFGHYDATSRSATTSVMVQGDSESDYITVTDDDEFAVDYLYNRRLSASYSGSLTQVDQIYKIYGDFAIDSGVTLTLDKGQSGYPLQMSNSKLTVNGTLFLKHLPVRNLSGSSWDGIVINSGGTLKITDDDVTIENASTGIQLNSGSTFDNNDNGTYRKVTISNSTDGILVNNCSPTIRKVEVTGSNNGINVTGISAAPPIRYVTVSGGYYGVNITGSSSNAIVDYCDFASTNTTANVKVNSSGYVTLNGPALDGNNIINDAGGGGYAVHNLSTNIIQAQNNYWPGTPRIVGSVDYSNALGSAPNAGVTYGKVAVRERDAFENAQILEEEGRYEEAIAEYQIAIHVEQDMRRRKYLVTSLLRTIEKHDRDYSVLKNLLKAEMIDARGWYRGCIDFILTDILFREGNIEQAATEFETKSTKYRNTFFEVEMLGYAAFVRGEYLNDKASAKALADRAAAVNADSQTVRIAYNAAGIDYDNTLHEDRFAGGVDSSEKTADPIEGEAGDTIEPSVTIAPNPANPMTTIQYSIAAPSNVTLTVYSVTGQKVATLVGGFMQAGRHSAVFNGADLASGVYFYRLQSDDFAKTGKMLLVR